MWRIYYADGSTFDDTQGKPEDAPATGVICILQNPPNHGWQLHRDKDYYLWLGDEWVGVEPDGFWQYMFKSGYKFPLFGVNVPDDIYAEIIKRATDEIST